MKAPHRNAVTVEDLLREHTLSVRRLAQSLRSLIRKAHPDLLEFAYPVWHGIGYRHPEAGYVCGVFPQQDSVRLGFEHGVRLTDARRLLEGEGRQVRYLTIRKRDDIKPAVIGQFLDQAIRLQAAERELRKARGNPVQARVK